MPAQTVVSSNLWMLICSLLEPLQQLHVNNVPSRAPLRLSVLHRQGVGNRAAQLYPAMYAKVSTSLVLQPTATPHTCLSPMKGSYAS